MRKVEAGQVEAFEGMMTTDGAEGEKAALLSKNSPLGGEARERLLSRVDVDAQAGCQAGAGDEADVPRR